MSSPVNAIGSRRDSSFSFQPLERPSSLLMARYRASKLEACHYLGLTLLVLEGHLAAIEWQEAVPERMLDRKASVVTCNGKELVTQDAVSR